MNRFYPSKPHVERAITYVMSISGTTGSILLAFMGQPLSLALLGAASSVGLAVYQIGNINDGQKFRDNLIMNMRTELKRNGLPVTRANIALLAATLLSSTAESYPDNPKKREILCRAYRQIAEEYSK